MKVQMNIVFSNIVSILVNSVSEYVIEHTIKYLLFIKMLACLHTLQTKLVQMVESKLEGADIFLFFLCLLNPFLLNLQDIDVMSKMSYIEYIVACSN
jgi:hypothetical protein